jgi:hypothetical protein
VQDMVAVEEREPGRCNRRAAVLNGYTNSAALGAAAYGWGNHATNDYVTGSVVRAEADTLRSVYLRGSFIGEEVIQPLPRVGDRLRPPRWHLRCRSRRPSTNMLLLDSCRTQPQGYSMTGRTNRHHREILGNREAASRGRRWAMGERRRWRHATRQLGRARNADDKRTRDLRPRFRPDEPGVQRVANATPAPGTTNAVPPERGACRYRKPAGRRRGRRRRDEHDQAGAADAYNAATRTLTWNTNAAAGGGGSPLQVKGSAGIYLQ